MRGIWAICGYLLAALVGLLWQEPIRAQDQQIRFQHLSIEDGLSNATVNCVLQDRHGFMWFGTEDGLNKYDGYDVTSYRFLPDNPSGQRNYIVRALHEDEDGFIWIGTVGFGLSRLNPVTEEITHFRRDSNDPHSLRHNTVRVVISDRDGNLWIATGRGISFLDRATGRFTHFGHDPNELNSLSNNVISRLVFDGAGKLWIGTENGLNKFDPITRQFKRFLYDPDPNHRYVDNLVMDLNLSGSGMLLIPMGNGRFYQLDPETDVLSLFESKAEATAPSNRRAARFVFTDRSNAIWIGLSGRGIQRIDPVTGEVTWFRHKVGNQDSLVSDAVVTMYEGRDGLLWVGTVGGGVDRINPEPLPFKKYVMDAQRPNTLSGSTIRAIYESLDGVLWIGMAGPGLDRLDLKSGAITNRRTLPGNSIRAIHESLKEPGVFWIGSRTGLERFEPSTGDALRYTHTADPPNGLLSGFIQSIFEDRSDRLWIGTGAGLHLMDRETGAFTHYPVQDRANELVMTIFEDRAGDLWVGADRGGLRKFDPETGHYTGFVHKPENPDSLGNNHVNVVYEDAQGRFWVGTEGGLFEMDRAAGTFTPHLLRKPGERNEARFSRDSIRGILEDERGNLWLSTGNGLCVLMAQTDGSFVTRLIEEIEGQVLGAFFDGAYHKGRSGDLYFGSAKGLFQFDASFLDASLEAPTVFTTGFALDGEPVAVSQEDNSILNKNIAYADSISVPPSTHSVAFSFATLDFVGAEQNTFAYKLEGFHDDWVYQGSKRDATFTNLDPGSYVLKVKAANSAGVWNEEGASLAVVVLPAWWETWWFRGLAVLAVIAAILLVIKLRLIDLEQRNLRLQREIDQRNVVEEELRQQREELAHVQRTATMGELTAAVAHEINQPLAAIRSNAQAAKRFMDADDPDLVELGEIMEDIVSDNRRAAEVITRLRELLRKQSVETEPLAINTVVEEVVGLLHSDSIIMNVVVETDLEGGLPLVMGNRVQLQQVLLNLMVNGFEAMQETPVVDRKLQISTGFEFEEMIRVSVRDTGPGFGDQDVEELFTAFKTTKEKGMGMGLAVCRSIVEAHGGTIRADNNPDGGADFNVALPVAAPSRGDRPR